MLVNKYFISVVLLVFGLLWPMRVWAALPIYISGVQTTGGPGKTTEDFVELYNPHNQQVNLSGYKLVKRTAQGTIDAPLASMTAANFIPAYGHYLWANSSLGGMSVMPDIVSSGSVADDNGVAIKYSENGIEELVDSVAWGQSSNGYAVLGSNVGAGFMLSRDNLFSANSTFSVVPATAKNSSIQTLPEDFEPSNDDEQQNDENGLEVIPEQEPPPPLEVPIVYEELEVTEILPNPAGTDTGQEQIELHNPTNKEVSLAGWYVGDGASLEPATNAYQLSGSILPYEYKALTIPAGKFTLLNSGTDTVQLFSPDRKVMFSISYEGSAGENTSYQNVSGNWLWQSSSMGKVNKLESSDEDNGGNEQDESSEKTYGGIKISEFFSGYGWSQAMQPEVELLNISKSKISLEGWKIEVGATSLKKPSDSAETIISSNDPIEVEAGEVAVIKFNSVSSTEFEVGGKYWVMLYSPDGKLQDSVNIKSLVSRWSWAKFGSFLWQWAQWSPVQGNVKLPTQNLGFNELVPAYKDAESESFIELKNYGTDSVYTGNIKLNIGTKYVWLPETELPPGEYLVVTADELPAELTLTGKKVVLSDANSTELAALTYIKAKAGMSYMKTPDGNWDWSTQHTPGEENVFTPPAAAKKAVSAKTSTKTAAAKTTTKPSVKSSGITNLSNNSAGANSNSEEEGSSGTGANKKPNQKPAWVFGVLAAVLSGAAGAVWYFTKEPEIS